MREIKPDEVVTEIGRSTFPQSMRGTQQAQNKAVLDAQINEQKAQLASRQTTEQILQERGKVYGSFSSHARVTQKLKKVFIEHMQHHNPEGYKIFISNPSAFEGMAMIFHKLGRIANGDPLYKDNWNDIAGYAKLVVDELEF